MIVRTRALRFGYGRTPVLDGVDLELGGSTGVVALIGPNAAGKSTLLRCLAGLLRSSGTIEVDGRQLMSIRSPAERTQLITYLPQDLPSTAALTVFEAVLVARRQVRPGWRVAAEDTEHVAAVLERLGIAHLADRHLGELSGGQRQLVAVGQALSVAPRMLLLDEPTSNLDLHHQLELLTLVTELAAEQRMSVVLAVHDLNLVARFADRVVVLDRGRVVADGAPRHVITPEMLDDVYQVQARVVVDDGVPLVIPIRARRAGHPANYVAAHTDRDKEPVR